MPPITDPPKSGKGKKGKPGGSGGVDLGGGGGGGSSGTGGSSGGSSGGGSSSGGGGGGSSQNIAEAVARRLRSILRGLNLPTGPWESLIKDMAQEAQASNFSPSSADFFARLARTGEFRDMFPGIGSIINQGYSVASAVARWRRLGSEYRDIASDIGMSGWMNKRRIGLAIRRQLSGDEVATRLLGIRNIIKNPEQLEQANSVRKQMGLRKFTKKEWFDFAIRKPNNAVYNFYEALGLVGVGVEAKEARRLASQIGMPGALIDLGGLTTDIRSVRQEVSQELRAQGMSEADEALGLLLARGESIEGAARERAERAMRLIEQTLANRKARVEAGERVLPALEGGRPISPQAARLEPVSPA